MTRPSHVVHFINAFSDGGTERQAIQLANALHLGGEWCVSVASHSSDGPLLAALAPELRTRLMVYPLRRLAAWHSLAQLRAFSVHLRRGGVDIVHTHGFYPNVFGISAARLAGVAVRVASKREEQALRTPSRAALERLAFGSATHIVANCHAIRAQLVEAGCAEARTSTIHNAVTADRMLAMPQLATPRAADISADVAADISAGSTAGIPAGPDDALLVTMVANFHHEAKDHAAFLRSARRVVDVAPETRFVLAGEGPNREAMEQRSAALGLAGHVTFTRHCSDVAALLACSAVCVLTSRSEGSPNAILEYMAAGRPVVATDVGGVTEAVVDGVSGFVVAAGDDRAIAAAILRLLSDRALRERMGAAGRARVQHEFTLSRQLDAVTALYRSELARSASNSR